MPGSHWHDVLRHVPPLSEAWQRALEWSDWTLAVVWCVRTRTLLQRLPEVPDLSETRWDLCPVPARTLAVIVPARDEAQTIRPAMETLLNQDYPWMRVIAIDDRSTDDTGRVLDELAFLHPETLSVLHLTEAAEGWVAKTFAMETAVLRSESDWLLFTDADVWFSPSLLRRALAYASISGADHVVIAPTPVLQGWGESMFLSFLSVLALWVLRPWRVRDARARWDVAGAGAFNLIRREAWEELGGFAPERLAVVEDVMLGVRVRAAGMQQRLVFAPGLLLLHWATGARGIVRNLAKNLFALVSFSVPLAIAAGLFVICTFLLPLAGLVWGRTVIPSLVLLACIAAQCRTMSEVTGIAARWVGLYPLGALTLLWALLRSVVLTMWRGGVRWRDSFYPLRELRGHNSLFAPAWEAARERAQRRRELRGLRGHVWSRLGNRLRGDRR